MNIKSTDLTRYPDPEKGKNLASRKGLRHIAFHADDVAQEFIELQSWKMGRGTFYTDRRGLPPRQHSGRGSDRPVPEFPSLQGGESVISGSGSLPAFLSA